MGVIAGAAFLSGALTIVNLDRTEAASGSPSTTSAEAVFARDMQNHHAQAIEMAVIARDRSTDSQIREIASDLALSQQQEIGQMRALLAVWRLPPVGPIFMDEAKGQHPQTAAGREPGMSSQDEIEQLGAVPRKTVGIRFFELMIPHHETGIRMAEAVLANTEDPVVRDLVTTILRVQRDEVTLMKDLLQQRGIRVPV
ncbi:DUF305 domain-containing protein [Sporichthya polymorpha]|uniref:DUF305 domain-containing protein n=1 Tax=Sporichthya polymorpha TaxID=35751 RepID=UPI000365DF79|nr:DUF305 domain-containing protein [Sporichthya polymorpha]